MDTTQHDLNSALMLDGNAAAGLLERCFGCDVTDSLVECDGCGRESPLGAVQAYTHAPGLVLRCAICSTVMVRVAEPPSVIYLDARGVAFLRLRRRTGAAARSPS